MPDQGYSDKVAVWRSARLCEVRALAASVIRRIDDELLVIRGLDYGCNDGLVQAVFEEHDSRFRMAGADANPAGFHKARAWGREVYLIRNGYNTGLADAEFDFVICLATLAHIPDPAKALKEMHRVLRPGGFLIVETPHPAYDRMCWLWNLLSGYQGDHTIHRKVHPRDLLQMSFGKFECVRTERTGRKLPWPLHRLSLTSDYRMTLVKP